MLWYVHKIKWGKRDRFWLSVVIATVAILIVLKALSHNGFRDPGRLVWKSAILDHQIFQDTLHAQHSDTIAPNRAGAFRVN